MSKKRGRGKFDNKNETETNNNDRESKISQNWTSFLLKGSQKKKASNTAKKTMQL